MNFMITDEASDICFGGVTENMKLLKPEARLTLIGMNRTEIIQHLQEVKEEIVLIIPDEKLLTKMFIAGGSIRSMVRDEKIADYDVFLRDTDGIQELKEALAYRQVLYESKNSIGLITSTGKHIQFIICATGSPSEVVGEFDFTCNMNYFEFRKINEFVGDEGSELFIHPDTSISQLKINPDARNAMGTFLRIGKFLKKGFEYPSRADMVKLGVKLSKLEPIEAYSDLDNQSRMSFNDEEVAGFNEYLVMDMEPRSSDRIGSAGGV